jgi:hypothetical protein
MSSRDNNKQVSAAVRILQQKRDASARATHLMVKNDSLITYEKAFLGQAAVKKFFIATFLERKTMSTKTSIKRIALVAASALAIGGFSVISAPQASAATTASIALSGSGAVGSTTEVAAGLTYTAKALNGAYFPTVTITAGSSDTAYLISSTGVGSMYGVATPGTNGGNVTYNNNTSTSAGFAWHKGAAVSTGTSFVDTNTVAFAVTSATAGDQVITLVPVAETNKPLTLTISWGAAAVVSASASTSFISTVKTDSATADVASIQVANTAGTQQAVISVTTNSAAATTINGTGLRATISGPGTLGIWSGASFPAASNAAYTTASSGRDISISAATAASHDQYLVTVWGDGTSGVSTITLTAGTTVIATETLTWYGAVASIKATVKKNVAGTGAATTAALDVVAYDAANVVVPSVGLTITSDKTSTVANYTSTSSTAAQVAAGTAVVDVTGAAGTFGAVVLTIADTATKLIKTTATVNVGATEAATVTAAFDAASYNAGDKVTLTLTALDKNGVPVADSTGGANSLAITTNGAVQGTMPTASAFVLGKQVITFYAPLVAANLQANIKLAAGAEWATALDDTTIVASATVEGDGTASLALDAANAATDAANNAYDEAQNATQAASDALAAVTALAAQVKSLIASVKKLTAAVAKLKR